MLYYNHGFRKTLCFDEQITTLNSFKFKIKHSPFYFKSPKLPLFKNMFLFCFNCSPTKINIFGRNVHRLLVFFENDWIKKYIIRKINSSTKSKNICQNKAYTTTFDSLLTSINPPASTQNNIYVALSTFTENIYTLITPNSS